MARDPTRRWVPGLGTPTPHPATPASVLPCPGRPIGPWSREPARRRRRDQTGPEPDQTPPGRQGRHRDLSALPATLVSLHGGFSFSSEAGAARGPALYYSLR